MDFSTCAIRFKYFLSPPAGPLAAEGNRLPQPPTIKYCMAIRITVDVNQKRASPLGKFIARKKNITAVMLTAHAFSPDNLVKSIKEGADSYLPKEEMKNITRFLIDILKAQKEKKSPWGPWQERLPSSYFEKRWGAAWQDKDKEFWERFRASIKARKS